MFQNTKNEKELKEVPCMEEQEKDTDIIGKEEFAEITPTFDIEREEDPEVPLYKGEDDIAESAFDLTPVKGPEPLDLKGKTPLESFGKGKASVSKIDSEDEFIKAIHEHLLDQGFIPVYFRYFLKQEQIKDGEVISAKIPYTKAVALRVGELSKLNFPLFDQGHVRNYWDLESFNQEYSAVHKVVAEFRNVRANNK